MLRKLLVLLFVVGKSSEYTGTFKKIACEFNKDYFMNVTCSVKPVKRLVSKMRIEADLIKEMSDVDVSINCKLINCIIVAIAF